MKVGVVIGKFLPPNKGNISVCQVAKLSSDSLIIIVLFTPIDPISIDLRTKWLIADFPNAEIKVLKLRSDFTEDSFLDALVKRKDKLFPSHKSHFFGSLSLTAKLGKRLNCDFTVVDPEKLAIPTDSKKLLKHPYSNWWHLTAPVRNSLRMRVVIVGPESVGKSTLAQSLRDKLKLGTFLPEYGRSYEIFRDSGPYKLWELEKIINIHSSHRKALLPLAGPIFIEDTDELVTGIWSEVLIKKKMRFIEQNFSLPKLYIVLDPTVPFVPDPIRYFPEEKERMDFFDRITQALRTVNADFVTLTGDYRQREKESVRLLKLLIKDSPDWSKISNDSARI